MTEILQQNEVAYCLYCEVAIFLKPNGLFAHSMAQVFYLLVVCHLWNCFVFSEENISTDSHFCSQKPNSTLA